MPLKPNSTSGALTRKRLEDWVTAFEKVAEVAETDAAQTLSASELLESKLFTCTPTAARNFTTATAAQIVAALTDEATGTSFEFTIVNLAASTHAITVVGGTNVTIVRRGCPVGQHREGVPQVRELMLGRGDEALRPTSHQ